MTYIDAIIEEVEFNSVEQKKEKIKAFNPHIVVNKDVNKPYYYIKYYDVTDKKWHLGFGSYNLSYVIKWLEEEFEEVNLELKEVKYATWKINCDGYYPYCSNCKTEPKNGVMSKYCPECGAEMKQEKERKL